MKKTENLLITKSVDSIYFIVSFVLQWIHFDHADRQDLLLIQLQAAQTATQYLLFLLVLYSSQKKNRIILLKF